MREIKFRVRDKNTKKVIGYEYFNTSLNDGYYFIDLRELKENETVDDLICHTNYSNPPMIKPNNPFGQLIREEFTGMLDRKDEEIYEGDIIEHLDREFVVEYSKNDVSFVFRDIETNEIFFIDEISLNIITVIGNVYENQESLKEKR